MLILIFLNNGREDTPNIITIICSFFNLMLGLSYFRSIKQIEEASINTIKANSLNVLYQKMCRIP